MESAIQGNPFQAEHAEIYRRAGFAGDTGSIITGSHVGAFSHEQPTLGIRGGLRTRETGKTSRRPAFWKIQSACSDHRLRKSAGGQKSIRIDVLGAGLQRCGGEYSDRRH